jgi:hypothetical protein
MKLKGNCPRRRSGLRCEQEVRKDITKRSEGRYWKKMRSRRRGKFDMDEEA